jgi:SAM-dependent methyltransferase
MTTVSFWDAAYRAPIRLRLPSPLLPITGDFRREIRRHVKAGDKVLEIGFAPGKQLAWIASALDAEVSGIDYSEPGVHLSEQLFSTLGLKGDLRCEDVFATSFPMGTFDVVYSLGVIEHFRDPRAIVRRHFELLRPGGIACIAIPNYGGVYGRLQERIDPDNLHLHNTNIMSPALLEALMPSDLAESVQARAIGRVTTGLVSLDRVVPAPVAKAMFWGVNAVAHLQPFQVSALAPWIVCVGRRR